MRKALHKSSIPESRTFLLKELKEPHFDPIWHAHSEYQLFVVLEGSGTRFIGDSISRFRAGELILLGPHIPHLWRSDERYFSKDSMLQAHGLVLYLDEDFPGKDMIGKLEFQQFRKLMLRAQQGIEFLGRKKDEAIAIMQEMLALEGMDAIIALLKLFQLLAGIRNTETICHTPYQQPYQKNEAARMNLVYDHVMKNFSRPIPLAELAELVHMTPPSFSRYFTMRNNKTVSDFLKEVRIAEACKRLSDTDDLISDISYSCGFNTLSNFNVQFRALMHCRPSEYRGKMMQL